MPNYQAFLSYSHEVDRARAQALQRALERLAQPWYQIRSRLRIFRDDTDLSIAPKLERVIFEALERCEWLLLFASPKSVASPWVAKEITWWRGTDRLIAC